MAVRLRFIAGLMLVGGLAAVCGGSSQPHARPTEVPETVATPVPTPAPLLKSTGWLVYLQGNDLYVGDLSTGNELRLTSGAAGAAYAGYTGSGDRITVYYTTLIEYTPQDVRSVGTARLSRRGIDAGAPGDLLTFHPVNASTNGKPLAHAASVAWASGAIAYADDAGVHRYEAATGATSLLLANSCQMEPRPEKGCVSYLNPQWSPDGRWLLAAKLLYEGSISVLVDADDPASVREFPDVGGDEQSWSPDSLYFCAFNEIFAPGGVHLISPVDGSRHPRGASLGTAMNVRACAWSEFGKLAVADDTRGTRGADRVAVFGIRPPSDNDRVFELEPPYTGVVGWLPDGSGLIVQGYPPCVPCGERSPIAAALLISDGLLRSLPFAATFAALGDGVVGAITSAPPKDD